MVAHVKTFSSVQIRVCVSEPVVGSYAVSFVFKISVTETGTRFVVVVFFNPIQILSFNQSD